MGGPDKPQSYVVEAILDKRHVRGKWEYLIKWEGYSDADNTWEPQENCICPELMDAFEETWAEKKRAERAAKVKARAERKKNNQENGVDEDDSDDEEKKGQEEGQGSDFKWLGRRVGGIWSWPNRGQNYRRDWQE